jgi:L-ascorbate metabolism protein UlaG (beta-lactamase superfamily)
MMYLLGIILLIVIGYIAVNWLFSTSRYQGAISDHFDGKHFYYPGTPKRSYGDVLKWIFTRNAIPWPVKRELTFFTQPETRVSSGELRITFVNHATILIQWEGINILTDPVWSKRVSPFRWIGPKRVHPPGIAFEDLPVIDLILISHNHYDSLDLPTLKKLFLRDHPMIIAGLGNASLLKSKGIDKVDECDWWKLIDLSNGLQIIFTPAQHFSARGIWDRDTTLWGGFVIRKHSDVLYFSGDTAYCGVFKQVKERYGNPRLAMLPIGAYEPRWFMKPAHMSAEEAVQAHLDVGAKISLAYHFGTFQLSDEGIDDPPEALRKEMARLGVPSNTFWVLEPGQSRSVP